MPVPDETEAALPVILEVITGTAVVPLITVEPVKEPVLVCVCA
jgi:hypothetical protein